MKMRAFSWFVVLLSLLGCTATEVPDNYKALAHVVDISKIKINYDRYRYPPPRAFRFYQSETNTTLTTLWRWSSQCPIVANLAAHRNNQLGKTMVPSQRFSYEIELLTALKKCQAKYEELASNDDQLVSELNTLQKILGQKSDERLLMYWATIWNDHSVRNFFAGSSRAITFNPKEETKALSDFRYMLDIYNLLQSKEFDLIDTTTLEQRLLSFEHSQFGGTLIRHLQYQSEISRLLLEKIGLDKCTTDLVFSIGEKKVINNFLELSVETSEWSTRLLGQLFRQVNEPATPREIKQFWNQIETLIEAHRRYQQTLSDQFNTEC